jgi:hypothetical protein
LLISRHILDAHHRDLELAEKDVLLLEAEMGKADSADEALTKVTAI